MKAILFLGTSLFGAEYLPKAAEALGLKPIFLLKINDYSGMPRQAIEACEHYEADVNSLKDILRAIQENDFMDDVIAITSLLDETLQNACAIAQKFKIAGPDLALVQLTDKSMVKKIIPEFSPPSLEINLAEMYAEQLKAFLSSHGSFQEFVLKPGISSGAVGISIVNRSSITVDQLKQIIHDAPINETESQNWILQPRIVGSLYSLEGYVKNGQVTYLGFSKRTRKELTEVVNEFPVDDTLPINLRKQCQTAIKTLVDRSGYKNGYFHCEFIIDTNTGTCYLIDGNMGRIAGGAIVQQFALIYGKNAVDMYKHFIDLSVFSGLLTNDFSYSRVNEEKTLLIYYCLEKTANVLSITSPEQMICTHVQVAGNGKTMPAVGTSDSAWVGFVAGFKEQVLEEIQSIVINTDNGPVSPYFTSIE